MRRWLFATVLVSVFLLAAVDAKLLGIRWGSADEVDGAEKPKPKKDKDYCYIDKSYNRQDKCQYVKNNTDKCEGGSYTTWTTFVMCEDDQANRIMIIVGSVLYLLVLFIMISSAADDFFSPNVAAIVAYLGISESIAGVTFMAFGNGAPDIFGAIASVLSTPKPKAGFALGELLGAGIFVTLMVTATIVFTKPFKVARFETVRDLIFYLVALGWILFVFLFDSAVHLFEPLVFLGIYAIYVCTVIFSHFQHQRRKKAGGTRRSTRALSSHCSDRTRNVTITDGVPEVHIISDAVEKINGHLALPELPAEAPRKSSLKNCYSNPVSRKSSYLKPQSYAASVIGEGDDNEEEMMWVGHTLISGQENRSRAQSIIPPTHIEDTRSFLNDLYDHFRPLAENEWEEANLLSKAFDIIKIPIIFAFKVTIPLSEHSWSKPVAIVHTIAAPQLFLFAIQESTAQIINGGPGIWAWALALSAIIVGLILFFTTVDNEPKYYRQIAAYMGFLMSIAWIYLIANEVVNVVTMFGVISQVSHEVLGLTILAWSNSIGDLIADVAVVKQGYPRMALAAAIGGPLFNLLIGFGLPFTIARLKGTHVQITFSSVNHILILFLCVSLTFTLCGLFVQRFRMTRPYAVCNCVIYLAFIAMVILAETGVFKWGDDG